VIGFSLGAAIAIIEGAKNPQIDSVVSVGGCCDFWKIDYHFWEKEAATDMKIVFGPKGEGRTIRPGNPFEEKVKPTDVIAQISPRPVHMIHGEDDWLIKPYHSEELYAAAKEPKRLTLVPGEGHADTIYDRAPKVFEKVCLDWFRETL